MFYLPSRLNSAATRPKSDISPEAEDDGSASWLAMGYFWSAWDPIVRFETTLSFSKSALLVSTKRRSSGVALAPRTYGLTALLDDPTSEKRIVLLVDMCDIRVVSWSCRYWSSNFTCLLSGCIMRLTDHFWFGGNCAGPSYLVFLDAWMQDNEQVAAMLIYQIID